MAKLLGAAEEIALIENEIDVHFNSLLRDDHALSGGHQTKCLDLDLTDLDPFAPFLGTTDNRTTDQWMADLVNLTSATCEEGVDPNCVLDYRNVTVPVEKTLFQHERPMEYTQKTVMNSREFNNARKTLNAQSAAGSLNTKDEDMDLRGELGLTFNHGIRQSHRVKTYTEKGYEYTLNFHVNNFRKAVTNHKRSINLCQCTIDSGYYQVSELLKFRNNLEKCIISVSDAFYKLTEFEPSKYDLFFEELTECEATNRTTLHNVTEALRSVESNGSSKSSGSHKSGHQSKTSKSHRSSSHKTKLSIGSSSKGAKSVASMQAEAVAKAATLRGQLKYLDAENEQKIKLEKLKIMRDLEIEEAKCLAFSNAQISNVLSFQLPSINSNHSATDKHVPIANSQTVKTNQSLTDAHDPIHTTSCYDPHVNHSNLYCTTNSYPQFGSFPNVTQSSLLCPVVTVAENLGNFEPHTNQHNSTFAIPCVQTVPERLKQRLVDNCNNVSKPQCIESAVTVNTHSDPIPSVSVQQSNSGVNKSCNEQIKLHFLQSKK